MPYRQGAFRMDRTAGELVGFEANLRVMQRYQNITSARSFARMLKAQADVIYDLSQRYVPVAEGLLKKSGRVVIIGQNGAPGSVEASVVYGPDPQGGENNAYYAVFVHEIPKNHAYPTSWKYLDRAVRESWGQLTRVAADALDLGRGFFVEFGSV